MTRRPIPSILVALTTALVVTFVFAPSGVAAASSGLFQAPDLASQTLGRAYWHVFIAYAVLWLLLLGWVVWIVRRLSKLERKLRE